MKFTGVQGACSYNAVPQAINEETPRFNALTSGVGIFLPTAHCPHCLMDSIKKEAVRFGIPSPSAIVLAVILSRIQVLDGSRFYEKDEPFQYLL